MSVVDLGKLQDQKKLYEEFDLPEEQAMQVFDYLKKLMAGPWKSKVAQMTPQGMQMNVGALAFLCYMTGMNDGAQMIIHRDEEDAALDRMMEMTNPEKLLKNFKAPLCPECGQPAVTLWCGLMSTLELVLQKNGKSQLIGKPKIDHDTLMMEDEGVYRLGCAEGHQWESEELDE